MNANTRSILALSIPDGRVTVSMTIQEPLDECNDEVFKVLSKDPMDTARQDHPPETEKGDSKSRPPETDKASSAKKRQAAAKEATSATEGSNKNAALIVKTKNKDRSVDAKEDDPAVEARKDVPAVEPSSREVFEVLSKDPTDTAKQDHPPKTEKGDSEPRPPETDKVSSGKKRQAAAEEATSATEGPDKDAALIVKAKNKDRSVDAKEEALEVASSATENVTKGDASTMTSQELGIGCSLGDSLQKLLQTESHIASSTDKELDDEQSPMMLVGIPSSTCDSTQENEEEAIKMPERTSTGEKVSSATKDAPEE